MNGSAPSPLKDGKFKLAVFYFLLLHSPLGNVANQKINLCYNV